jgi:hypothetical protein
MYSCVVRDSKSQSVQIFNFSSPACIVPVQLSCTLYSLYPALHCRGVCTLDSYVHVQSVIVINILYSLYPALHCRGVCTLDSYVHVQPYCSLVHVGALGVLGTFGKSQTYPGSQPTTRTVVRTVCSCRSPYDPAACRQQAAAEQKKKKKK